MDVNCFTPNTTEQIEKTRQLGLSSVWLQEVGMKALAAYNKTTIHDAATASGQYAYLAAVRSLRDVLCPNGWECYVHKNIEMVTNTVTGVSITVSSGDGGTGKIGKTPKTKNQKGAQTKAFVSRNKQLYIHKDFEPQITNINLSNVWVFLYHVDNKNSEMRLELSLPIDMDFDGIRVGSWDTRIILNPIDFSNTPVPPAWEDKFTEDIELELRRK